MPVLIRISLERQVSSLESVVQYNFIFFMFISLLLSLKGGVV